MVEIVLLWCEYPNTFTYFNTECLLPSKQISSLSLKAFLIVVLCVYLNLRRQSRSFTYLQISQISQLLQISHIDCRNRRHRRIVQMRDSVPPSQISQILQISQTDCRNRRYRRIIQMRNSEPLSQISQNNSAISAISPVYPRYLQYLRYLRWGFWVSHLNNSAIFSISAMGVLSLSLE